jgi:hypothetical protein
MGTNPYKEKMPNRGMGREIGSNSREEDDEKPQDVNVQQIGTDPQIPGPKFNRIRNKLYTGKKKQDG